MNKKPEPKFESVPGGKAFSEGLTEENDIEVKESLLAMSVRFLKHGKNWRLQRIGSDDDVGHILLSTRLVKSARFTYFPSEEKPKGLKAEWPTEEEEDEE